jgi:glyceraldehyde-3-phosphate dehydrogenase (NAD(P))
MLITNCSKQKNMGGVYLMSNRNIIHVVGTGTIGEPLIGLLCDAQEDLGIDEVTFYKHSPKLTDRPKIKGLIKRGANLAVNKEKTTGFQELGIDPMYNEEEAISRASVIIDCTPKGTGMMNKEKYYNKYKNKVKGFMAQGSEFGFGKMYALGINDEAITPKDKFIHIVSCNTHNIAVLIKTLGLENKNKNFLKEGRFLCIRRANDISQVKSFIPSPEVGSHKDPKMGTHHAVDVYYLYKTLGIDINVFSSALKINTQYMHSIWFDLKLDKKITKDEVIQKFVDNPRVAITHKNSANLVFSFGREHGHYGRLLDQTVVVIPTIHVLNDNEVIGFCFTLQDGNSILSSVTAAERFLYPSEWEEKIKCLGAFLLQEV